MEVSEPIKKAPLITEKANTTKHITSNPQVSVLREGAYPAVRGNSQSEEQKYDLTVPI